jgi:hypothetical protein
VISFCSTSTRHATIVLSFSTRRSGRTTTTRTRSGCRKTSFQPTCVACPASAECHINTNC